jgi:hypothetical protein
MVVTLKSSAVALSQWKRFRSGKFRCFRAAGGSGGGSTNGNGGGNTFTTIGGLGVNGITAFNLNWRRYCLWRWFLRWLQPPTPVILEPLLLAPVLK